MRVSTHYGLGLTQAGLDFVDVDIERDTALFLSPRAVAMLPSAWGHRCVHLVQTFFGSVLEKIRSGDAAGAMELLEPLREPNETHLGLSKGKSRGRALGTESAQWVWEALTRSEAAKSGLLEDLEDTVLLIEGVGVDIVSDITTNIIRSALIEYTQVVCAQYEMPTVEGVNSGPLWDARSASWSSEFVSLPVTPHGKLLLVPKSVVRRSLQYDTDEYYRHYLLEHMKREEIRAGTELVFLVKSTDSLNVTKKSLMEKYGTGKKAIVRKTLQYPEVLAEYKQAKEEHLYLPLDLADLAAAEGTEPPDWDKLLDEVTSLPVGRDAAAAYEKAVSALLTALFYHNLVYPITQHEIHDGRKRIDITYTNMALDGFFHWLASHYAAPHVFVECKNYGGEVGNPELDQLAGRFSPSRGVVGLLVCRNFLDKELFLRRCRDTAMDHRGYIIALDDGDLADLVVQRRDDAFFARWHLLQARMRALVT